jgi:hypothetical protein
MGDHTLVQGFPGPGSYQDSNDDHHPCDHRGGPYHGHHNCVLVDSWICSHLEVIENESGYDDHDYLAIHHGSLEEETFLCLLFLQEETFLCLLFLQEETYLCLLLLQEEETYLCLLLSHPSRADHRRHHDHDDLYRIDHRHHARIDQKGGHHESDPVLLDDLHLEDLCHLVFGAVHHRSHVDEQHTLQSKRSGQVFLRL